MVTREQPRSVFNGWLALAFLLPTTIVVGLVIFRIASSGRANPGTMFGWILVEAFLLFLCGGFFTLQPNMSAVLILFGAYKGTVKSTGFKWANPLYKKVKISLRWHNLDGAKVKVNDLRGNPIEISAVIVWRVEDTAKAVFDVEHYEQYVNIQSESALRHLAMSYPYDTFDADTLSLRGSPGEVNSALQTEVQERVSKAGVVIGEARLNHLAYAPEIAGAMLQRQQAEAVVAARSRIVEGAVGMVEMALDHLERSGRVELDEERKGAMVSELVEELNRWARDDIRSLNAQIEFLLREAVRQRRKSNFSTTSDERTERND